MPNPPGVALSLADRLADGSRDVLLLIGRLALGAIFVESGFGKLTNIAAFAATLASRGVPASTTWATIGACVEFFGGLAIVLGVKTRYASVLMLLFVIVATGISHRFWELAEAARRAQEVQFFKNLSIIGAFVLLFVSGGGRFGFDGWTRRGGA